MSGSDTSTREWEDAFNSLQGLISSEMIEDDLRQKVVSISLSIDDNHKLKLFTWMLDTLCDPTNDDTDLHNVLLELIPSITSRDNEEKLIQCLKSYVARNKSQGTQTAILSITRMLHRTRIRFKPMPLLRFLCWCTDIIKDQNEAESCMHEIVELQFSCMAQLDDEADILGELKAVRRSIRPTNDNEEVCRSILKEIVQVVISSLRYENIRAAYQSVLLVTEPKDCNGLDVMVYLVLFHLYKDTSHELLKILHKDIIVEADDRCNMSMNTSKKSNGSSYILPLVITTMKQIDVSSFEMQIQSILIQAASDLGLHLLHSPVHHPHYPPLDQFERELNVQLPIQLVMTRTKQYISDLFGILPSENKDQMVSALLSLSDTNLEMDEKEEKTFWSAKEELMERFPLSIRKIIKVGEVPDDSNPVQRRHWEDVRTSSAIILVDIVKRYKIIFGMDIILGRLEAFGRKQWSGRKPKSDISSTNNYHDFECAIAEIYCDALVAYAENAESGQCAHNIDNIDLMTMVQRMLFSFFDLDKSKRSNMADRNGNVVLGMILARYFVQSTMSSDEDCNMVVEWVTRIVVNQDDSEWLQLDAVSGYWGICLICSLCPEVDTSQLFSFGHTLIKNDDTKSKAFSLSVEDAFDRIKVLALSRIGMVQSESAVMASATDSVLGYTNTPRCYFQPTGKSKKRLTFCVASLCKKLNPNGIQSSGEIQEWFRFVGCLTGVFLKFAYVTSGTKWTADCWLLASIELLPYTESDVIELSSNYRFVHSMGEVSLEMEDLEGIDSMSANVLFQSAYTFIIAIAVEHAVLINCYSFLKNGTKATKAESLMRLIQYQLAKLYDLNHHFHRIMEFVMDLNDQSPEDSNVLIRAEELKAFVSNLFHSVTFIPPILLLDALQSIANHSLTKKWDDSIRSVVTQKRGSTSLEVSLQSLLEGLVLECCTSHHLNTIIKHRKRVLEQAGGDSAAHATFLVLPLEVVNSLAAFQSLKMKMLWLPLCKRFYVSDNYLSGTIILRDPMVVRNISDQARNAIILHLELAQNAIHANMHPDERAKFVTSLLAAGISNNIQSDDLVSPLSCPLYELMKCIMLTDESIITSHMLDLVSYLPLKRYDWIQKVTWKFVTGLDTDKNIEPPEAQILYHLPLPFVQCICDHFDPDISPNDATNKALVNLVRLAIKRMVDYDGTIDLSHILLTHWSHAMSRGAPHISYENFNQLVSAIEILLENESGSTKSGRSSQKYQSVKADVAVNLTLSSVPVIYDLVLHLIVATMGVFGRLRIHATNIDADHSKVSGHDFDEIYQVLDVLKIFDKMMNIYSLRNNNFPKSMMQSTVNVCLLVIRICEGIASKYSKREITDAFPRKRILSANPLKSLVDGMKEHCCESVSKVCNIDSSSDRTRHEVTILSLLTRNEKMRRFLFSLESACNLGPSSLMVLPSDVYHAAKRRSDVTVDRSPKKARVEDKISFHTERNNAKDVVCTTAQDDDDSFGVDGDWGNDTGSDLEDGKLQADGSFQL